MSIHSKEEKRHWNHMTFADLAREWHVQKWMNGDFIVAKIRSIMNIMFIKLQLSSFVCHISVRGY